MDGTTMGVILTIAGLALTAIVILAPGFKRVQQQERIIVERFGAYLRTAQPGLQWIIPLADKVKRVVPTWRVRIPLFEQETKIDFIDGSAFIRGAEGYVQVKNPDTEYDAGDGESKTGVYRATYATDDWEIYIRDLLENAIRSYLNGLTIDRGITQKGAGFDLKNKFPPKEVERITGALDLIGFGLDRVTIMDFDLDAPLLRARGAVQIRKREAEAAEYVRDRRAIETIGTLIQMAAKATGKTAKEVQAEIVASPELRERLRAFGEDLVTRQMSIDGKALTDIRVNGADGIERTLLNIAAAWQRMPKGAAEEEEPQEPEPESAQKEARKTPSRKHTETWRRIRTRKENK